MRKAMTWVWNPLLLMLMSHSHTVITVPTSYLPIDFLSCKSQTFCSRIYLPSMHLLSNPRETLASLLTFPCLLLQHPLHSRVVYFFIFLIGDCQSRGTKDNYMNAKPLKFKSRYQQTNVKQRSSANKQGFSDINMDDLIAVIYHSRCNLATRSFAVLSCNF